MNIPVDIHTHRLPQVPGTAIANCYPETFSPQSGGWYSVGIHPWHIGRSGGEHSGAEDAAAYTLEIEEKLKKLAQWQADKIQNARKTSTQTQEQVILDLLREHL